MTKFADTLHADIIDYGAKQGEPYNVYKQGNIISTVLGTKQLKNDYRNIVLKYYPHFSDTDILNFLNNVGEEGCTFAHMANIIINSFKNQEELFAKAFGYSIYNEDRTYTFDKVMVELYSFLSTYADITLVKQDSYKFSSIEEASQKLLGRLYDEEAYDLICKNYIPDGLDEAGNLIFKNKNYEKINITDSYKNIAQKLFGVDDITTKDQLEKLLKERGISFSINNSANPAKLSGLVNQVDKWINIFFDQMGLDAEIRVSRMNTKDYNESEIHTMLMSGSLEGLFIGVSSSLNSEVYGTDGSIGGWTELSTKQSGHAMTFYGFDKDDNFLVLSWGKIYMIPKGFYQQLDFSFAEIIPKEKQNNRQL